MNYEQGKEKLVTDRFSTSVAQIGNTKEVVRIGGIYSLERIAKDSPKDHWTIMEVLTAYVRQNSPLPPKGKAASPIPIDIQSALTVIRRRNSEQESADKRLDLSSSNLREANLIGANLIGANLSGANLSEAENLTVEQVKSARNWKEAIYDEDFRKQLGLPPETPKNP